MRIAAARRDVRHREEEAVLARPLEALDREQRVVQARQPATTTGRP